MKHALLASLLISLVGCASSGASRLDDVPTVQEPNLPAVERTLRDATTSWHGTPHVMGGTTQEGVDCSGFVMRIFEDRFGLMLPRSTRLQVDAGVGIDRDQLRAGDLVLFHTGRKTRHVGIYLSGNEFAHVSSSRGVTISDLTTSYWQDAYWTARRVLRPAGEVGSRVVAADPPVAPPSDAPYGW